MEKVSIIIPAYNESSRIKKCLDSLLKQSYQNLEIIVINDGSTDDTLEILHSYKNSNLKVFSIKNSGQGAARNFGIKKASGDYLMFVDADDYVDIKIVELLMNNLKENNSDVSVCDLYKVYDKNNVLFKNLEHFCEDECINLMLSHPGPVGRLYKRKLFLNNEIFFVEKMINEDLGTIPLLGIYINKVSYLPKPLYYYVIHENSTTQQKTYSSKMEDIFKILEHLKKEFKNRTDGEYRDVLEYLYIEHLLYSASLKFLVFDKKGIVQIKKIIEIISKDFPNWKRNVYLKHKSIKFKIVCNLVFKKRFKLLKLLLLLRK